MNSRKNRDEPVEAAPAEPVAPPAPDYEAPEISGEAPAEFALIDEFADRRRSRVAETPAQARVGARQ